MAEKKMVALRLSEQARRQLPALARRWRVSQAQVIELAAAVLADPALAAALSGGYQAQEQALRAWAGLLNAAGEANAREFSRAEWNLLADTNNGCSPLLALAGGDWDGRLTWLSPSGPISGPLAMVAANAHDGHRLDGAGQKWLGKDAGRKVAGLVARLQALDLVRGWALLAALQWFWEREGIDLEIDAWWEPGFRRKCEEARHASPA